tara:strand:+ start:237796 stop:238029 length:234 start_codon:yes stop_codon:yes gene_type:complete
MTQAQTLDIIETHEEDDLNRLSSYSALKAAFTEATGTPPCLKEKFICAGVVVASPVLKPLIRYISKSIGCCVNSGGY